MSFTIVVIAELLVKHVPLMPVAEIQNSPRDDAFVHLTVELHTNMSRFYFILHIQGIYYSSFRNDIYIFAVFLFFSYMLSAYLIYHFYNPSYSSLQKDI